MRLDSEIKLLEWANKIIDLELNTYRVCLRNHKGLPCVDFGYSIICETLKYYDWHELGSEFLLHNVNFLDKNIRQKRRLNADSKFAFTVTSTGG